MNCDACQEQLRQTLDGTTPAERAALDQHLVDCADCRAYQETTRRLLTGLQLLRPPAAPTGFTARLVASVQEDRRRLRHRKRLRFVVGFAVAASVVIAVSIWLWPKRPITPAPTDPPNMVQDHPNPNPPKVATVTPRQSMASAVEAMASLTTRTTSETFRQTKNLIPRVEPNLSELPWETTMPTLSLDAGHGVSEGLEPMATHAKRAVGLLRRDMLPDF